MQLPRVFTQWCFLLHYSDRFIIAPLGGIKSSQENFFIDCHGFRFLCYIEHQFVCNTHTALIRTTVHKYVINDIYYSNVYHTDRRNGSGAH